MSYNISTNKSGEKIFSVICNEPGCKAHFDSKVGKGDAWQTVKADGWFSDSASNHRCVTHKPARATRAPKTDKVTKTKVAQTKAEKSAGNKSGNKVTTTKSGAKVTVGNRVAPKTEASAFKGQSIGKAAKSARKSA